MRMRSFERRWAAEIARAIVPADAFGGLTAGVDYGEEIAAAVARSPWWSALLVRFAVLLAWLSPPWVLGRLHAFGGLDEASRVALLERLLASPLYSIRETMLIFKMTVCTVAVGRPEVLARLGAYDLAPAGGSRPGAERSAS